MEKFVPREKMSKKERKRLDAMRRREWETKPVTRIVPNKKKLEESRKPHPERNDAGWGFAYIWKFRKKNTRTCRNLRKYCRIFG